MLYGTGKSDDTMMVSPLPWYVSATRWPLMKFLQANAGKLHMMKHAHQDLSHCGQKEVAMVQVTHQINHWYMLMHHW